jgi:succinyl-diaminopimelate desuccinylase
MHTSSVTILQDLVKFKGISPGDGGAIEYIAQLLSCQGFSVERISSTNEEGETFDNLYAELQGTKDGSNFCFAGHVDVVPVGDVSRWSFDPFAGEISNGIIYGRGVVDMKGGVAAFLAATLNFLKAHGRDFPGMISFIIASDEETSGVGTPAVLEELERRGRKITHCLLGECSSSDRLGDNIKIGCRGTINFTLIVRGKQGHVAYQQYAHNPITDLVNIMHALKAWKIDEGDEFFGPSNLEFSNIKIGNPENFATNLIPASAQANFNIRHGTTLTSEEVIAKVKEICEQNAAPGYPPEVSAKISGLAFKSDIDHFHEIVIEAVKKHAQVAPELITGGGTSDGRFIFKYAPLLELGLSYQKAHKVDESASINDVHTLTDIYYTILKKYFGV